MDVLKYLMATSAIHGSGAQIKFIILNKLDKRMRKFYHLDNTPTGSYTYAKTTKWVIIQTMVNLGQVPI